ncbi:PTS sugar transporter subunit IIA [Staphylococcus microti]|uniref:PTS sugar transporter subunit IIA n=1 Tax=Staphylococcus microti TaxID=569857 RepID=A0A0D6XRK4_9STAP|nr:PTS sugar transporter subunit IIA [Staphylococcus microti]PNZ79831.1 PRD domain-containing protein [Staphylococcus microti]SUM58570.1 transcriptional antiterminator, BglG family/PTS system mannitol/fructose-specific IIA component [Staphylococcus microti]
MLSDRQRQIVAYLSSRQTFVTIAELANQFHVSERTIQYDVAYIESFQTVYHIEVVRNKSLGIQIHKKVPVSSADDDVLTVHYSKEERKDYILLKLFESTHPVSSTTLAEMLHVSRRTVVEDLKGVQHELDDYGLNLAYIRNKGFVIEGNERDLRDAYAQVVHTYFNHAAPQLGIAHFSQDELERIRQIVVTALRQQQLQLVQEAIDGLIFHIVIAIHRARDAFHFEIPEAEYQRLQQTEAFQLALEMTSQLEASFDVAFPKTEAAFITLHLLGAKGTQLHAEEAVETLTHTIQRFIQQVSAQIGVPFERDHKLRTSLLTHLQPAIHRMRFGMVHTNPLKDEIMRDYPDLIRVIQQQVKLLENVSQVVFNNDEIAYLALHFASSMERVNHTKATRMKVILLCGSGVGTSQLLKSRIQNIYPELEILDAFSIYDISESFLQSQSIDYIISTVPTHEFSVPSIIVSPFLNKADRKQINQMINAHREATVAHYQLAGPTLKDVLTTAHIVTEQYAENREAAIQQSVDVLVASGHVDAQYAQDILTQLDRFGPYMVISPHIALVHAHFEHVRVPVSMALMHFKDGVDFHHERFDPVKVVIVLATSNAQVHLNALGQLSQLMMDDTERQHLVEGNRTEIIRSIQTVSQEGEA